MVFSPNLYQQSATPQLLRPQGHCERMSGGGGPSGDGMPEERKMGGRLKVSPAWLI